MLPSVILFVDGIAVDRVTGFEELGGKDEFRTETLERVLTEKGMSKNSQVNFLPTVFTVESS